MEITAYYQYPDMMQEVEKDCGEDIHLAIKYADGAIENGGWGNVSVLLEHGEVCESITYALCDIYYESELEVE